MSEQDLVQKLKNDDISALKILYEQYQEMVFNVCYKITGIQEDAEDLTQDAFLAAYTSIHTFRENANFSTWLYRIAVNQCLKHQRRKKVIYWLSLDFLFEKSGDTFPSSPESPDSELLKREHDLIVRKAVGSLPEKQKIALILRRYEKLSYREIAEVLDVSVSAVESLIHRAKEKLAKKLLHYVKNL